MIPKNPNKKIPQSHQDLTDDVASDIEVLKLLQLKASNRTAAYRKDYEEDNFTPLHTALARAMIEFRSLQNYLTKIY